MKKIIIPIITLILLSTIITAQDWTYHSNELEIKLDINFDINIEKTSENYNIDYIQSELLFFPKDSYRQTILSLTTDPESKKEADKIIITWDSPNAETLSFNLNSRINTKNTFPKITKKVKFPLESIPEEYKKYTLPTENIDINEDIANLASNLAEGEDDLYIVMHKLSEWVINNIEYDLSCGDRVESSSWTLKNKIGVCDEFTSLLISLCRSLDIPAKYSAGVAYSNKPELENFGPHAWAEVYFPEFGWVPFDTTYAQLGYLDPTHLKLAEFLDSDESSTKYEWKARNIEVNTNTIEMDTKLLEAKGNLPQSFSLNLEPLKKEIGLDSYNLIKATITNPNNHYISTELILSTPSEIKISSEKNKLVLLSPKETKELFWIINIDKNLDDGYSYTFPVIIQTTKNYTAQTSFTSSNKEIDYSKEYIEQQYAQLKEEKEKTYSSRVDLDCSAKKTELYLTENTTVNCIIKNKGNTILNNLNICFNNKCEKIDLSITQEKEMNFKYQPGSIGKIEKPITAKNTQVSKSSPLIFNILDKPVVEITNIISPKEVSYTQEFTLSFTLKKGSFSDPKKLKIRLERGNYKDEWELEELNQNHEINLKLKGNILKKGNNQLILTTDYQDKDDNQFTTKKEININLINITFTQQIKIWLSSINNWLTNLFT